MGCAAKSPELPPCGPQRPAFLLEPWAGGQWCVERVVSTASSGAVGYAHLTAAPDGTLYATLPERGQVAHITNTNNDDLLDAATPLIDGLTRPLGIDYHDGALYIAGNATLYRYDLQAEALTVLADDIPWGWTGYPTAGLLVHEDAIYVASGGDADCSPGRGAVYRYDLDGTNREAVVTGVRAPSDIAAHAGHLWLTDAATDRVLQVQPGTDLGACSDATPTDIPAHTFAPGSAPFALLSYTANTHAPLTGTLLTTLRGTPGQVIVTGYAVQALPFDGDQLRPQSLDVLPILPPSLIEQGITRQRMHIQGSGFYPDLVYGLAVDANGWIYISHAGSGIMVLRPFE